MADVIVIGAGLSGLAAAHRLMTLGLDVRLLERASYAGGHVRTVQRDGWRHEAGPNSFLGSATALHALASEVGLTPLAARPAANKRYLFIDGRLQSLPSGPLDAITTPLLPFAAKLRLLTEPLRRGRAREDESVREFFDRRLGPEVTSRFVDAFVAGIYAGDVTQMGIAASFPKLYAMAKEHGSLTRGAFAAMRTKRAAAHPERSRGVRGTFSFANGLRELPDALAKKLGDRLELGAEVTVARDGDEWIAGSHRAPELVLATPAGAAASLLEPIAPELSRELTRLDYAPIAGVHLLHRTESLRQPLDGFGFLVPRREGVRTLGCIWSSALFDVAPAGHAALTCFIGGARDREALALSDAELIETVERELARMMGLSGAPVDAAVVRHARAIPQYGTGHVAWRSQIDSLLRATPGLSLAGNFLDGISMGDTIARGERVAGEVAARRVAKAKAA